MKRKETKRGASQKEIHVKGKYKTMNKRKQKRKEKEKRKEDDKTYGKYNYTKLKTAVAVKMCLLVRWASSLPRTIIYSA